MKEIMESEAKQNVADIEENPAPEQAKVDIKGSDKKSTTTKDPESLEVEGNGVPTKGGVGPPTTDLDRGLGVQRQRGYVAPGAVAVIGVQGSGTNTDIADPDVASPPTTTLQANETLEAEVVKEIDFEGAVQKRIEEKLKGAARAEVITNKRGGAKDGAGRRNAMIMLIFGLGVVCFAIALSVMLSYDSSSKSEDGTSPNDTNDSSDNKSTYELAVGLLESVSNEDTLQNSTTAQYEALEWISKYDPIGMELITTATSNLVEDKLKESATTKFVERYVLGLLYFSTSGPTWFNNVTFLSNSSVCDWGEVDGNATATDDDGDVLEDIRKFGIVCNERENVVQISLFGNNLYGTIPSELSKLSFLEGLDLNGNELYGTIPENWGDSSLEQLSRLNLGYNSLVGPLPSSFSNLRKLTEIQIADCDLTGTIPSISKMTSLEFVHLTGNLFTGPLPDFPEDTSMLRIWISFNMLTGTLPESWFTEKIEHISIWYNSISGTISPKIGDCKDLTYGDFDSNQLTGAVPTEIGLATNLQWLYWSVNNFTSTIPTELGLTSRLEHLWLHDNQFTGRVPTELANVANLPDLNHLTVQGNKLMGDMNAFCSQGEIVWAIESDCGVSNNDTSPFMDCPCCVKCCDGHAAIPGVISENDPTCRINHLGACEVEKATIEVEGGVEFIEGAGTVCDCVSANNPDDPEDVVISCVDTECISCNRDRSVCAKNVGFTRDNFNETLVTKASTVTFQYVVGLNNETVSLRQWKRGLDDQVENCEVTVNDQKCNGCSWRACPSGFRGFEVNCENIPGVGRSDVCDQDPQDKGLLTVFALQDPALLNGCPPRFGKI